MDADIKELDENSFDEILKSTEKLIIVEFYTTICPNCRVIAPVYADLAKELQSEAIFSKVNSQQNVKISSRYGIMGVPTFKFFCKGRPIGELVGAIHATILRNTIKDLIKHRHECASKSTTLVFEIDGYG
ncbi:MAG: thioredoxin family protein [Thermoplasmata archaeon]